MNKQPHMHQKDMLKQNSVGCSIVTTGPGGTNAVSGVSCCWIDSIPMIFISGQVYLIKQLEKVE